MGRPGDTDSAMAWRMAAAAFVGGFIVFGVVYSFGVLLPPLMDAFGAGRAATTVVYAAASMVWYMLGPFTGRIADRRGPRAIVAIGAIAMGAGHVLTAFADSLWFDCLAYGLGVGLGAACVYVPTLANLGGWFARRRNLAFAIAAAGTGCGMLAIPPATAFLIDCFGWRAAELATGAIATSLLLACALAVSAPPAAHASEGGRPLLPVLRSSAFATIYLSWALATTALFVPFVFLPQYAADGGAGPIAASTLISILGGASVAGRLGIGLLGARLGSLALFKLSTATMMLSYLIWLACAGYWCLVAFAVLLGAAYGSRIALVPGVLIELFGTRDLGTLLGVLFTGTGIAAIVGPALAGHAIDLTGDYAWGIAVAIALGGLGVAAILPIRQPGGGERTLRSGGV